MAKIGWCTRRHFAAIYIQEGSTSDILHRQAMGVFIAVHEYVVTKKLFHLNSLHLSRSDCSVCDTACTTSGRKPLQ